MYEKQQEGGRLKTELGNAATAFAASCVLQVAASSVGTAYNIYQGKNERYNKVVADGEARLQGKEGLEREVQMVKNDAAKVSVFVAEAYNEAPSTAQVATTSAATLAGGGLGSVVGGLASSLLLGDPSIGAQLGGAIGGNVAGTMSVDNQTPLDEIVVKAGFAVAGQALVPIPIVGGILGSMAGHGCIKLAKASPLKWLFGYA